MEDALEESIKPSEMNSNNIVRRPLEEIKEDQSNAYLFASESNMNAQSAKAPSEKHNLNEIASHGK